MCTANEVLVGLQIYIVIYLVYCGGIGTKMVISSGRFRYFSRLESLNLVIYVNECDKYGNNEVEERNSEGIFSDSGFNLV